MLPHHYHYHYLEILFTLSLSLLVSLHVTAPSDISLRFFSYRRHPFLLYTKTKKSIFVICWKRARVDFFFFAFFFLPSMWFRCWNIRPSLQPRWCVCHREHMRAIPCTWHQGNRQQRCKKEKNERANEQTDERVLRVGNVAHFFSRLSFFLFQWSLMNTTVVFHHSQHTSGPRH